MYQEIREEPHLPAVRSDGGTSFVLTEDRLFGLLRCASEEAYTSAVGKWSGDAVNEEPVKHHSSFRRSRIDGVNPPSVKGQGRQQPDQSGMTRTQSSDVLNEERPARVRWHSPSVSGRSNDEYFDAPQSPSRSRSCRGQEAHEPRTTRQRCRQAKKMSEKSLKDDVANRNLRVDRQVEMAAMGRRCQRRNQNVLRPANVAVYCVL